MTFKPDQISALQAPLAKENVKSRSQSGRSLSYVEGWHVIDEANRIFGFDAWSTETVEVKCVSERERKIGQQQKDGWGVTYTARVRVTVQAGEQTIVREGCGTGHGIDVDLGQAHESALKESETDARKRALMTFGNPFGLALYDKEQRNVSDEAPPAPKQAKPAVPTTPLPAGMEPTPHVSNEAQKLVADALIVALRKAQSLDDLKAWWTDPKTQAALKGLPEAQLARVREAKAERHIEIEDGVPA
jgi:DNA recombination protein Rad52